MIFEIGDTIKLKKPHKKDMGSYLMPFQDNEDWFNSFDVHDFRNKFTGHSDNDFLGDDCAKHARIVLIEKGFNYDKYFRELCI